MAGVRSNNSSVVSSMVSSLSDDNFDESNMIAGRQMVLLQSPAPKLHDLN